MGHVEHLVVSAEEVVVGFLEAEGRYVEGEYLFVEADAGKGSGFGVLAVGGFAVVVAVVEGEEKVVVVGGGLHETAVGHDDVGLVDALGVVVDDDVAQGAAVGVFAVDAYYVAVDFVVIFAGADADGGFFALYVVEGDAVFVHGHGEDVVGEVEGYACHEEGDEGHGEHDAAYGNAAGFHGYEFVFFAEVAHGHDGGEEDGDGECHGDEGCRGVE